VLAVSLVRVAAVQVTRVLVGARRELSIDAGLFDSGLTPRADSIGTVSAEVPSRLVGCSGGARSESLVGQLRRPDASLLGRLIPTA